MGGGGPVDFCILDMVKKLVTITNDESVYELSTVILAAFFFWKMISLATAEVGHGGDVFLTRELCGGEKRRDGF